MLVSVRRQQIEDSTKILQRGFRRLRQRWHLVMNTYVKNFKAREWRHRYQHNDDNYIDHPGGGFKYFLFSPWTLGKWSNLTTISQMGWFNHQLDYVNIDHSLHIRNAPKPPWKIRSRTLHFWKPYLKGWWKNACNFTEDKFENNSDDVRDDSIRQNDDIKWPASLFSHFFLGRRFWKDGCFINPGGWDLFWFNFRFAYEPSREGIPYSMFRRKSRSLATSPCFQHCISSKHILVALIVVVLVMVIVCVYC